MLNLQSLKVNLKIGEEDIQRVKGKEIIMPFGKTGAGKTTIICTLVGIKMIETEKKVEMSNG